MRRTYRSKKECGNALDHHDVIQNLDEKASVFDAFYIQKIKQTKRELSCIGSSHNYGAASNKVRKRKYVKRIVKEVEASPNSLRDSLAQSVFLTPDKSIRVNKAQDLFDQLLNSSPPRQTASPVNSRQWLGKFVSGVGGKTCARKKLSTAKKFNYSSSDSNDSDKENSNKSSHDVTDIRKHELIIEKPMRISPKYLDDSINNMVKKISILNNIRGSSGSQERNNQKYKDHRLTTNFASPDLSKSPLCSTPFKEKYRSQSIYKFSPICLDKHEASPNYVTVVEENDNNDSVVILKKKKDSTVPEEDNITPLSPIIQLSVDKSSKSDKSSNTASKLDCESPSSKKDTIARISRDSRCEKMKSSDLFSIELSDFQTTEVEPFRGFSNPEVNKDSSNVELAKYLVLATDVKVDEINQSVSIEKEENNEITQHEVDTSYQTKTENDTYSEMSSDSKETEDYDTCDSDQSLQDVVLNDVRLPVVNLERLNNSLFMKYYVKKLDDEEQERDSTIESDNYASIENSILLVNSDDSMSLADDDDKSLLEKSINNADESHQNHSVQNSQEVFEDSARIDLESSRIEDNTSNYLETSVVSKNINGSGDEEEDRCFNFVTTRRRNEITNNSIILSFNNSMESTSSADCDKTVLSNNEISKEAVLRLNEVAGKHDEATNMTINIDHDREKTSSESDSCKLLDTNNDTKADRRDSIKETDNLGSTLCSTTLRKLDSNVPEVKPIVLQPGKKWERSLSIYRRMTMMNDQLEHSILDDEQLQNKGRNYRQSVISTMELQDTQGSLHNDSFASRRSTFVSKPSRCTIRIVKELNSSRLSISTSSVSQDLKGFLSEDCDDTVVELSKLSIADSIHEVTVVENFHDTSNRITTARDYVLRRCNQADAIQFDECYPETVLKNCRKIGEGVYGEVFLWRARDGRARVMKIVPIAGTIKVNGEHQKDFHEIISEIVIAMELSALRAPIDEIQREFDAGKTVDALDLHSVENATDVFNEVLAVKCVYGTYPSRLLDLWELYDECNGSENDNPAILPPDQQYIVLELANAGQDLESFEFNNAEQAHALFLQIAFGLAVAEEAYQFEHRDLHWGNVLIAPTDQKFAVFVLRGRAHLVPRCGVAGTIIDYSLSRVSIPLGRHSEAAALYNDLATDDGLFDAVGDRQFEVYRLMREKLGNDWKNFEPYTNILWLHYTVDKMITALRYKRTNTKIHKHYIAKLKGIKNRILDYGSAAQFVLTDNEF